MRMPSGVRLPGSSSFCRTWILAGAMCRGESRVDPNHSAERALFRVLSPMDVTMATLAI